MMGAKRPNEAKPSSKLRDEKVEKAYPCQAPELPCDSYGICENCDHQDYYAEGWDALLAEVRPFIEGIHDSPVAPVVHRRQARELLEKLK